MCLGNILKDLIINNLKKIELDRILNLIFEF